MKQTKTSKIALVSILAALSVVLGYFVKIPTPTGFLTLLDAGIFFTAFYFSLIFHGSQGYLAGVKGKWQWLGLVLATIIMVAGYAFASAWMNGWGAAIPEIVPNLVQNIVGMTVGFLLCHSVKKAR